MGIERGATSALAGYIPRHDSLIQTEPSKPSRPWILLILLKGGYAFVEVVILGFASFYELKQTTLLAHVYILVFQVFAKRVAALNNELCCTCTTSCFAAMLKRIIIINIKSFCRIE